jgi:pimeloyl-ACP methyl ester carboxylesterase
LGNGSVTLATHIEDVVAHIKMEDLRDVTLVSQSYGGVVATGTLARIPDRIRSMIYLDAFVPEDGKSLVDCLPPELQVPWMVFRMRIGRFLPFRFHSWELQILYSLTFSHRNL